MRHTQLIAHRGASAEAPENTLPAFALALQQGAQMIEFDVRPTSDGQVVVFHDDTTARWDGQDRAIAALTLREVRQLDIGGAQVPTLDEVCAWAADTGIGLNVELKVAGIEAEVARIVGRHGVGQQVIVSSFDLVALETMRAVAPELKLGALMGSDTLAPAVRLREAWPLPVLRRLHARAWHPAWQLQLLDRLVPQVRQAGYAVYVWTVDDPAVMRRLLRLQVDGIMTNRPALLRQVIEDWVAADPGSASQSR